MRCLFDPRSPLRFAAMSFLGLSACVRPAAAKVNNVPGIPERGAFAVVRGRDTVAVESFERRANVLSGEIKAPGGSRVRYRIEHDAGNRPAEISLAVYPPGTDDDARAIQRITAAAAGDSLHLEVTTATGSRAQSLAIGHNTWLIVGQSSAEIEHLLASARRANADSVAVAVYPLLGGRPASLTARFFGADSAAVTMGARSIAHFDEQGRLTKIVQGAGALVASRVAAVAWSALASAPVYEAPTDAPYTAEQVTVQSREGITLAGTLTRPRVGSRQRVPAVITISGSGPQDRDSYLAVGGGYRLFRQIADTLSRRGIAVLRLDDRGTGASGGDFAAAKETDFAADVEAAVSYLRARSDIDPLRISLLGHSEGGVIGPLVAARDPKIAALVLMAGPADPRSAVIEQNRSSIASETRLTQMQRDSVWRRVPMMLDSAAKTDTWFGGFLRYDGRATAARIKAPVLILQGATDTQVPANQATLYERFFREGGNQLVTTRVLPRRNHLFLVDSLGDVAGYNRLPSTIVDREVLGIVADWLARVLGTK